MVDTEALLAATAAPADRPRESLDARDLPPPRPLRESLEHLATLDPDTVFLQLNDRAPQHLYPELEDRGYRCETVEHDDLVVTVVWRD
jgi:hypothetical protein